MIDCFHRTRIITLVICHLYLGVEASEGAQKSLQAYQEKAKKFGLVLTAPDFETTPAAINTSVTRSLAEGSARGDLIAKQDLSEVTFASTIGALDDLFHDLDSKISRIQIIKETSPLPEMRQAATEGIKNYQEWSVAFQYREDVYKALKAYAATAPELRGEEAKLLKETLRDYQRSGLDLPQEQRRELEALQKKLVQLSTEFRTNINQATTFLTFSRAALEGVPESFLKKAGTENGDDVYTVKANITWQFLTVMRHAKSAETRKKVLHARYSLAKEMNIPLLQQIVSLRSKIARKLGYQSWFDYKTEVKMAKDETTVSTFLRELCTALRPKFEAEKAAFRAIKATDTGESDPNLHLWDWRYYRQRYMQENFTVDTEALRAYFPYEQTLVGMFAIYESIFGLEIEQVDNPNPWFDGVTLYVVTDVVSGEPLGLFYLDMFPRPGKFNHFAQFSIISGKQLSNGNYQRPTVALICNFPPPNGDGPTLLTYEQVGTLFHEFGHCLHSLLTRAKYYRFSGTSVPRDFVEAPSQMLEYWLENKEVLDLFAADYRDPTKKIPRSTIEFMIEAKRATIGTVYKRQLAFGMIDLALHRAHPPGEPLDVVEASNAVFAEVFFPVPDNTAFVAYFGHLMGYDAGYYGYGWADVIAADMATVFEKAPRGFLDPEAGMRLRREIYETGDSRDVNESIKAFLGREKSMQPFYKKLGLAN